MRASRLVGLLGLLQARGRMTAGQLATELEVSQRTILRDIDALSAAGIPVYAVRGSLGGFELLDGFRSELPAAMPGPASPPVAPDPPAGLGAGRARVLLSPRGRRLAALLGRPAGIRIRSSPRPESAGQAELVRREGWIEAWMRIETMEAAVLDLLALGAEAEVRYPPDLRARVREMARRIAELHTDPGGASPEPPAGSPREHPAAGP